MLIELLAKNNTYFIIGLLLTAAVGFYLGRSPIPNLNAEINLVEEHNIKLQDQLAAIEAENQELLTRLNEISQNFTIQTQKLENITSELEDIKSEYFTTASMQQILLNDYYNLLLEYQGIPTEPQDDMVATEILGVVNGDFEDGNEGWVISGKGGLGPYALLIEYEHGTYCSQNIFLDSKRQGIKLEILPQPVGGDVHLDISVGDVTIFSEDYTGLNSDYGWEEIVIPFRPLFEMKERYGFEMEGVYNIKFAVPPDPNGGTMLIDNASLVEIEYQLH